MSRKFSRWLRSKSGTWTLVSVAGTLLVLIIIGQLLGWWAGLIDLITGTAVLPPPPEWPGPVNGYTCLPSCADGVTDYDGDGTPEPQDAQFISMPGYYMDSFSGARSVIWIAVPANYDSFEIGFFDGDSGKDDAGNIIGMMGGNWDETKEEVTYTLYADPLKDGSGTQMIGQWFGNQDPMPNNDWYDVNVNNVPEATGPSGHYFYRLEATRTDQQWGISAFKLRSNAYLSTGKATLADASFAIVGMIANPNDVPIVFYEFGTNYNNPGPSYYTGDWQFRLYVPEDVDTLELWDGDFDRGTTAANANDTDDLNTTGKPVWAGQYTKNEGFGGRGSPPDDYPWPIWRVDTPVWYEVINPDGTPIYTNEEPSGSEEWERFVVSTNADVEADKYVDDIQPGFYTWHIVGLDAHNTVWIRSNFEICPDDDCGPPVCDATCPRTIGYWKNNVKKVLIEGRTNGVQETPESIHAALDLIALKSPLFRHGIDVTNPQPIDTVERLTDEEVHMILQRDQKTYPGGKDQANSMLARALQQNLAAWLNWGSGKVCDNTVISLDVADGKFEGKLWDALQEAQDIILNGGNLERAKDIGDQINNGNLGENADLEVTTCDITDPDDTNSKDYKDKFPPDKQPPKYKDLPKAPKPPKPDPKAPEPAPDPETCEGVRVNQYKVEVTDNPFAGIKFEYQSGTEVKNSDFEEFKLTLTQEQAQALTSVQMEAKAGTNVGQVTLEGCDFAGPTPCGDPLPDENDYFAFHFFGAEDNSDGTLTLTFHIQNFSDSGLSHATIGIPDAEGPTGSYESKVCPPE